MDKFEWATLFLVVLSFIASAWAYPLLPEQIAVHWNARGIANGFSQKGFGLFAIPILTLVLLALMHFLPSIDPLHKTSGAFGASYSKFKLALASFMLVLHAGTIWYNLGFIFNFGYLMAPLLAGLFFFAGELCGKAKQNWFIGVRTPWTLSSEKVWEKTNRLAEKLFKASALIAILGVFSIENAVWLAVVPAVASAFYLTAYSYFEYQKEKKR